MNRKERLEALFQQHLEPDYLLVIDESQQHHVPENAQTHFKATVVSKQFNSMSLINRHKLVNELVSGERDTGMHALSLHLKTPEEWKKQNTVPNSPPCRDGFRHG